jgi:hypothetical protein
VSKSYRTGLWLAAAALVWGALPAGAEDKKPPKETNPLDALAPFVGGSWVSKGKGPTKGDFRTRVVYEWGLNHRVLKCKSYLVGDKGDTLVYESFFGWHPKKKQIFFYSFAGAGYIFEGTVTPKKDAFELLFQSHSKDGTATYRQTIQFLDKDNTHWTVSLKKGDEWVKVIDAKQHRQEDGKAPRK